MTDSTWEAVKCTTHVEVLRTSYTWVIKNVSFICTQKSKKLKSSIITVGGNKEYKWQLRFDPHSNVEGSEAFVGLYLQLVSPTDREVHAKFNFYIIMADGRKQKMASPQCRYFMQYKSYGNHSFIDRNKMLDETNGYVDNDNLSILCEVNVSTGRTFETTEDIHSCEVSSSSDDSLAEHLGILLNSEKFTDVTLIAKDNGVEQALPVHKAILAARSTVFAAMFGFNARASKQTKVEITDITANVLRQIVLFLYTGKAENLDNLANASDLLAAADKYALNELKVLCEQAIAKCLTVDDAIEVLEFAERYTCRTLKNRIVNYMKAHAEEFVGPFVSYLTEQNVSSSRIWYDFSFFEI